MQIFHPVTQQPPRMSHPHSFNRRATDRLSTPSASRDDILDAMARVEDPGQRVVLTILLRVVDEISNKIDRVLADEERIKMIVLGEFSHTHAVHHKYVEDLVSAFPANQRAVKGIQETHSSDTGHCQFAARHIEQDKVQRLRWIKVADGVAEKVTIALMALALGLFAPHLLALLK